MTGEAVAEAALLTLVFPSFQQAVRHRIVVDRKEEVGGPVVGAGDPLGEARRRRLAHDQQLGAREAGLLQALLDLAGEAQVEIVFERAARTSGARSLDGVSDVDKDAELAGVAFSAACVRTSRIRRVRCPATSAAPPAG